MYWMREILGWVLIVLGLWMFYLIYFVLFPSRKLIWAGPVLVMGIVVFRGGIHLLKVAVAARVCQQAPVEASPKTARPVVARPQRRATVVPGRR